MPKHDGKASMIEEEPMRPHAVRMTLSRTSEWLLADCTASVQACTLFKTVDALYKWLWKSRTNSSVHAQASDFASMVQGDQQCWCLEPFPKHFPRHTANSISTSYGGGTRPLANTCHIVESALMVKLANCPLWSKGTHNAGIWNPFLSTF